jgi:hypothetical protein
MAKEIFDVYVTSYKNKTGKDLIINIKNYKKVIFENFEYSCYLDIMDAIRKSEKKDKLQKIHDAIYNIADKAYFQKFHREISLEEKVKGEGFSFDVSIYPPIKASFLI